MRSDSRDFSTEERNGWRKDFLSLFVGGKKARDVHGQVM
jgi:hypothetical protein